jgi:glucokinase
MVASAAKNGDALALSIMKQAGSNLGVGLVNIIHSFDPEIIVLGGGLVESLDIMMPSIEFEISKRVMINQKDKVRLVVSQIEENVALLGAASIFFEPIKNEKQN